VLNQEIKGVREYTGVFGDKKLPHTPSMGSDMNSSSSYSSRNKPETFQEYFKKPATEPDYYSK
jgi:hypothetical protein